MIVYDSLKSERNILTGSAYLVIFWRVLNRLNNIRTTKTLKFDLMHTT
jgi:hypothetical protein